MRKRLEGSGMEVLRPRPGFSSLRLLFRLVVPLRASRLCALGASTLRCMNMYVIIFRYISICIYLSVYRLSCRSLRYGG